MAKTAAQLDREIRQVLSGEPVKPPPKRWMHGQIAKVHGVPEDVVRRIYAAVQMAKKQGLSAGYMVDLIERNVGRKLMGGEYTVAAKAREHLDYNPPSGYGGPKPQGKAEEPARVQDDVKVQEAARLVAKANRTIKEAVERRAQWARGGWNEAADLSLLKQIADDLDVAADLYEEAGPRYVLRAGTVRERARLARRGDFELLKTYDV